MLLTEKDLATNRQWLWYIKEKSFYRFRGFSNGLYQTFDPTKKQQLYLREDEIDLLILHPEDVQAFIRPGKLPEKVHCLLEGYMIETMQCFNQKDPIRCGGCNQPTRDLMMRDPASTSAHEIRVQKEPKKRVDASVDASIRAMREKLLQIQKKTYDEEEETEQVGKRRYVSDFDSEPGERIGKRCGAVLDPLFDEVLVERTHDEVLSERVKEEEEEISDDTSSVDSETTDEETTDVSKTETEPSVPQPNLPEHEPDILHQISVQTASESQKCKNFGKRDKCTGGIYCKGFCKSCYKKLEKQRFKQKPKEKCAGCKEMKLIENTKLQLCHSCINTRAKYRRKGYAGCADADFCTECHRRPAIINGLCETCNFDSLDSTEKKVAKKKWMMRTIDKRLVEAEKKLKTIKELIFAIKTM